MKGDFTRKIFRKDRHYRSVNFQQGRVQTDAEQNEQNDIQFHYEQTYLQDIIGKSGTKKGNDDDDGGGGGGFEILPNLKAYDIDQPENDEFLRTFLQNNFGLYWIGHPQQKHFTKNGNVLLISQGSHTAKIKLQEKGNEAILEIDGKEVYKFIVVENVIYTRGYMVGAGNYYVDGILCENEFDIDVSLQSELKIGKDTELVDYKGGINYSQANNPALTYVTTNQNNSYYLVYIHQWQKHVTSIEDSFIQEKALGDIDTSTRTKIAWQIKLIETDADYKRGVADHQKWKELIRQKNPDATGKMKARVYHGAEGLQSPDDNPHKRSGYQKLQNQLYRVEVHNQGEIFSDPSRYNDSHQPPTFKWSRDNGVVVSKILNFQPDNRQIIIEKRGRDRAMDFAKDQYVEITDDLHEDLGVPGTFAILTSVKGNTLEYDIKSVNGQPLVSNNFSSNPKIRRWEATSDGPLIKSSTTTTTSPEVYIPLEEGIEIQFSEGYYNTGDYWIMPARVRSQSIEWPPSDSNEEPSNSNDPLAILPIGIDRHYSPLAIVRRNSDGIYEIIEDLRMRFASLTDIYNQAADKRRYFATSGTAVLQLPSDENFTSPLIFGPFDHNLHDIDAPPSVHLGSYLDEVNRRSEPRDKKQEKSEDAEKKNESQSYEMVAITENFPGAPLIFKPIRITRTNFCIFLAKSDNKGQEAAFSEFYEFLRRLDTRSDDYEEDYDDDDDEEEDGDLTNQLSDNDRSQTSDSQALSQTTDKMQDIGGTGSTGQPILELDATTTDKIKIHWWAIPVHDTGEQTKSAIKLESHPKIRSKTVKGRRK